MAYYHILHLILQPQHYCICVLCILYSCICFCFEMAYYHISTWFDRLNYAVHCNSALKTSPVHQRIKGEAPVVMHLYLRICICVFAATVYLCICEERPVHCTTATIFVQISGSDARQLRTMYGPKDLFEISPKGTLLAAYWDVCFCSKSGIVLSSFFSEENFAREKGVRCA